jgi:hypothetical protein
LPRGGHFSRAVDNSYTALDQTLPDPMNEGLYLNALNKSLNVFKRDGQEVERVQVS